MPRLYISTAIIAVVLQEFTKSKPEGKEMSWDSYLDNLIARSKGSGDKPHIDKACIIGLDGSAWTTPGSPSALQVSND